MGRNPIGKRAMTDAERQARRRKKLKREQSDELKRRKRALRRQERLKEYIPAPPGITYWRKVKLTPGVEVELRQPVTRPLATIDPLDLEDDDIRTLLRQLHRIARHRGIEVELDDRDIDPTHASLLQATQGRPLQPGESGWIGPAP